MGSAQLEDMPDRVAEYYANKTVLVTGGTGFIGKVFVEKLLRACSDVRKVYVLTRTKKNKEPAERIREMLNGPLFDLLRKQRGEDVFDKVEGVSADVAAPDLALSPGDRQMLAEEVDLIYHCAATVRFDEPLQRAVFLNARGTKLMLELAKECKKLEMFIHVSTAYCHLNERILYEKDYPPPANPHQVIQICEWMDSKTIDCITPKILGNIPNTYAFSKALGEAIVVEQMENLPIIILRPSVVVPIWKEPLPGWTDNLNGPLGLLIGAGKGVIRTMYCKSETYADYIPVDIVANVLICFPFIATIKKQSIVNVTSSFQFKITFEEVIAIGRDVVATKVPLNGVLWYPGGSMKKSRILHNIDFFLFQVVPAVVLDGLLVVLGYKPILMKVQRKISKGYEVFEYYTDKQWDFHNDRGRELVNVLNPREKKIYKLDGEGIDYVEYFTECTRAARRYILKEPDDTIPAAKRHMKIMWFVDKLCKTLFFIGLLYLLYYYVLGPTVSTFS